MTHATALASPRAAPENCHPLRAWRLERGLSLSQAAEKVGTTRQVWHNWETGKRRPRPPYMALVRQVTGVSADVFYPECDAA